MTNFDTSIPALLVTIGPHAWDYGALATVRTLGRVGVRVAATLADDREPTAHSRYLARAVRWPTTGAEPEEELVTAIERIASGMDRPVVIAGDDETAVLLARHAGRLDAVVRQAGVAPDLPARLAAKSSLLELCAATDTPVPLSCSPADWESIEEFAARARFPVVVKNPTPFSRLADPAVVATTQVADVEELRESLAAWRPGTPLLIQEYLPEATSRDWYAEGLFDADSEPLLLFTGTKLRAYPRGTGIGTLSEAAPNPDVARLAAQFAKDIGYSGPCDMDWRFDRRDGSYRLLDFNPRRGAQFRLFRTTGNIDVVRGLHLWLTGRDVPSEPQQWGVRHVVGLQDQRAWWSSRGTGRAGGPGRGPIQGLRAERSWWAWDDPRPALAFAADLGPIRSVTARLTGGHP